MASSAIHEMEMKRLDQEIEKTRKQFYTSLLGKKRRVKRKWLEISAMTNAHLLQTLPYRAMLGHVAQLAEERDKVISDMLIKSSEDAETQVDSDPEHERINDEVNNNGIDPEDAKNIQLGHNNPERVYSKSRDEAIQTEESSFRPRSENDNVS